MSLSARVRSGTVFQIGARLFSACVSFAISAAILARVLPEAEFGVFNFYLTLFLLVLTLADFGANRAAIRLIGAEGAARGTTIAAAAAFKTLIGALAFAVMAAIVLVAEPPGVGRILLLVAAAHALTHGMSAGSAAFEVDVDFKTPAQGVALGAATFLAGGLALAAAGVRVAPPYLVAYGAGLAAQNAFLWLRQRGKTTGLRLDRAAFARLAREALPIGLSALGVSIYYYSDTLLLRPLSPRGEEDVARYSAAYRLMTFGLMVPVLFSQVLFPVFARCARAGGDALRTAVRRSTFYLWFGAGVAGALLLTRAADVLELVFGATYRPAAPSLRVLALAMMVVYVTYPHTTALIAGGGAATFTRITLWSAALNLALNVVLIPPLGPLGAALATLATEACVCICGIACLWRARRIHGFAPPQLAPAFVFVALTAGLWASRDALPVPAAIALALAVAVFAARPIGAWPFHLGVDDAELR